MAAARGARRSRSGSRPCWASRDAASRTMTPTQDSPRPRRRRRCLRRSTSRLSGCGHTRATSSRHSRALLSPRPLAVHPRGARDARPRASRTARRGRALLGWTRLRRRRPPSHRRGSPPWLLLRLRRARPRSPRRDRRADGGGRAVCERPAGRRRERSVDHRRRLRSCGGLFVRQHAVVVRVSPHLGAGQPPRHRGRLRGPRGDRRRVLRARASRALGGLRRQAPARDRLAPRRHRPWASFSTGAPRPSPAPSSTSGEAAEGPVDTTTGAAGIVIGLGTSRYYVPMVVRPGESAPFELPLPDGFTVDDLKVLAGWITVEDDWRGAQLLEAPAADPGCAAGLAIDGEPVEGLVPGSGQSCYVAFAQATMPPDTTIFVDAHGRRLRRGRHGSRCRPALPDPGRSQPRRTGAIDGDGQ